MATPDLRRLGERVQARRLQLNLSVKRAAVLSDLSIGTWKRVEASEPVRHMTYDKVEAALGWTVGSCRKIMDGGDPALLDELDGTSIAAVSPSELADEISHAVSGAMVAGTDLNASKIREVNERALAILRARGILPPASN